MDVLDRARTFLLTSARLLERRIFASRFEVGPRADVVAAVRAYRNTDGGFGHALEPDLRGPASQPTHVEIALQVLREAGAWDDELARGVCTFLASVANEDGAVAPSLPGAADHPCAAHWREFTDWALTPDVNPTAAIAAHLNAAGVTHPWVEKATAYSRRAIAERTFKSAHTLRAAAALDPSERVLGQLADAEWFTTAVPVTTYTLTPLHFAPSPDAPTRAFFADDVIEAHLDDLLARQQDDGGWPIFWNAPGDTATAEWRGRWTIEALLVLRAYGRI